MTCSFQDRLVSVALDGGHADGAARAHAPTCVECSAELRELSELLAEVGESLPPVPAPPEVRAALFEAVDGSAPFAGFARRVARLFDITLDQARTVLSALADPARWEAHVPGVDLFHLLPGAAVGEGDAGFVRFAPGLPYPRHEHHGDEIMLLVSGSLRDDETGERALPGDVLLHGIGTSHSFRVGAEEPCVVALLLYGGPPTILES